MPLNFLPKEDSYFTLFVRAADAAHRGAVKFDELMHEYENVALAANLIKDIEHDRAFSGADITAVNVLCTVETSDRQHIAELYRRLAGAGVRVIPTSQTAEMAVPG